MKSFVLISTVCLQLGWVLAVDPLMTYKGVVRGTSIFRNMPAFCKRSSGVGAFAAQDSSGKRYEATYGLKDGEVVDVKGNLPPNFKPPTEFVPNFEPDFVGFFPEYFRNLETLLQDSRFNYYAPTPQIQYTPPFFNSPPAYSIPDYGLYNTIPDYTNYEQVSNHISPNNNYNSRNPNRAFQSNLDSQQKALGAAHKAFDLTSNQAGYSPDLNPSRLSPFYSYEDFPSIPGPQFPAGFPFSGGFPMNGFGNGNGNGAASGSYAGAAVGPGYSHQVAAISPSNPNSPNVYKSSQGSGQPGGFKSVSVSSYSSSSDVGGRRVSSQGADTYVNDNGKESRYSVHSP